jgi:hypothetical protein
MRHPLLAALVAAFLAAPSLAQEKIDNDQARRIAKLLVEASGKADKTPIAVDPDPDKPFGMRHQEYGALVLPAHKLSADTISKAGKDYVAIGQVWLRNLAPQATNKTIEADKLLPVKVSADGQELKVALCVLAVRKTDKGELELAIFGKGKTPLVTVPLKSAESKQTVPVEFDAERGDEAATITLKVAGKYQAVFTIAPQSLD